jgi:hypothetical protein
MQRTLILTVLGATLASCSSTGYTSQLQLEGGMDQKSVLLESVNTSREEQIAAQAEFIEAIDLYSQLVRPGAEEPEKLYKQFQHQVDDCAENLGELSERITLVEEQAARLFENWALELDEFASPRLRAKSEAMLLDTEKRFDKMSGELAKTHALMDEVLIGFRDYVIFFNHNLNPRALATLHEENTNFLAEIQGLKNQIALSRAEADGFIQSLDGHAPPGEQADQAGE